MGRIKLWAPKANRVDLEIRGVRLAMSKPEEGWWEVQTELATPGADYGFMVDGGQPLPDPRSAWQPHGVHGPSKIYDHQAFYWTDTGWQPAPLSSAVIYELHVGTFSPEGTFAGVAKRLDHLMDLGVTHLELMPVNGFSGSRGWGYDGVNLFAPHEAYGGPQGLKGLVDDCHARGLAVILDVVYNHLGPEGNYLEQFGPYLTDRYSSPWGKAVNLDGPGSDEVRRFFCDNALMWLRDYHFDGLRIDAVHAIVDTSAVHFLEQLAVEVEELQAQVGRHLTLIAESDLNDPRVIRPREIGGYGIDAQWNDDFHHALHTVLTGERDGYYSDFGSLSDLAKALNQAFIYDGRYSEYRQRRHGRPVKGLSGLKFLAYLQNHDQVGNRAKGERSSHLMSTGRLKVAAALVFTSPFIPMLFQGEEWGSSSPFRYFTDHSDPELQQAVREGRQQEFAAFGWKPETVPDPQAVKTFERSKLDWDERSREPHCSLLDWHRRLIHLRRNLPSLTDGRLDRVRVAFNEEALWLALERGPITVLCNLVNRIQCIPLGEGRSTGVLLSSEEGIRISSGGAELPADSVVILGPTATSQ
jgi:maltooligosyltrehalose trehalohydrolase